MSAPVFTVGQAVQTFDKYFEPELPFGSEGVVSGLVLAGAAQKIHGYDVEVTLADGTPEIFFFHEHELKPVE